MIPPSMSASAAKSYENCPAQFFEQYVNRVQTEGGGAADLGTACHLAAEHWVEGQGWLQADPKQHMRDLFIGAAIKTGTPSALIDEGIEMMERWAENRPAEFWAERTVLSNEVKKSFDVRLQGGNVWPFNYIIDRVDELANGEIMATDYKSWRQSYGAEDMRNDLQFRMYALALQLEHPDADRIWVCCDQFRHSDISIAFTKAENRETWHYLVDLCNRIEADEPPPAQMTNGGIVTQAEIWPKESINRTCRWCVRANVCKAIGAHAKAGGTLGISDPGEAADRRMELVEAKAAISTNIDELERCMMDHMVATDVEEYVSDAGTWVQLNQRKSATVEPTVIGKLMSPDELQNFVSFYGNLTKTNITKMLGRPPQWMSTTTIQAIRDSMEHKVTRVSISTTKVDPL